VSDRRSRAAMRATAVTLLLALAHAACARHVTMDPDLVATRNPGNWTIRGVPGEVSAPATAAGEAIVVGGTPVTPVAPVAPVTPVAPVAPATPVAPVAPVAALPFRQRPDVARALATAPDSSGVPEGLYAVDPLLSDFQADRSSQASARRSVAIGLVIVGLALGGLGVWAISEADKRADSPDEKVKASAGQLGASGIILTGFALGDLIAAVVTLATSSDRAPLQRYYRETYATPAK
jgi:hypothetical protein